MSDIEGFIETDDEVEDRNWTPHAEYEDESCSSSNEEDAGVPTVSQATKGHGRDKVNSTQRRGKTHTAESDDQTSSEEDSQTAT